MARSRSKGNTARRSSTSPIQSNGKFSGNDEGSRPITTTADVYPAPPGWQRRFTRRNILAGIGIVLVLAVLSLGGYIYWTVQKAMPTINGAANLPGLSAPVTVIRDTHGVPHIVAANVEDLYAAQGYVSAQDRLFQMFYFRQLGAGKLAEVFGPAASSADIFLRTLGLRRAAEADVKLLSPQARAGLEAYARGVNGFLHSHADSLPLEFNLLGTTVADWQPADTAAFGKVMAWDLSGNWDMELTSADLNAKLGLTRTQQLIPDYPTDGPFIVPGPNSGQITPSLQAFNSLVRPWLPSTGISGLGSNNWVIDGAKSATGKPLLSNDPHLGVQNPSIWYQVHLSTTDGKYDAEGFTFAGVPGIVTGHNQNIAWGVTNVEGDVQDLFIEKLDPEVHPGQYMTPDGWKPMQILTETINVKGAEPITQTIRITRHGPLLSDALQAISSTLGSAVKDPLAFQWTAAEPGHLMDAVNDLQEASNWQEFRAALSKWDVPGQNFVYADKNGNIGYQMTGNQVVRKNGNGKIPVPGWTGEYDWGNFVPYDDLPRTYNPPEHFIATANNKNFGPDLSVTKPMTDIHVPSITPKYPIQGTWAPPWRISRILEMLKAKEKLSIDDFKQMLMDTNSPMAKKVAPLIANLKPNDSVAQDAVKMLQGWDGNLSLDSTAASIYEVTVQKALSETFSDDLGDDLFFEYLGNGGSTVLRSFELLLDKPDDPFWDRTDTSSTKEKRDDILLKSLTDALADLSSLGTDMTQWTWGKLHTITPMHTFGEQPLISGVFNLPSLPFGGDGTTVSVGGFDLLNPFAMRAHQSYRMIIDLSNWSNSLAIYAGGQSGQPFNKHWGDMFADWQQGNFYPMLYTKQEIDANTEGVLTLNP